jgi:hypothetical protein
VHTVEMEQMLNKWEDVIEDRAEGKFMLRCPWCKSNARMNDGRTFSGAASFYKGATGIGTHAKAQHLAAKAMSPEELQERIKAAAIRVSPPIDHGQWQADVAMRCKAFFATVDN